MHQTSLGDWRSNKKPKTKDNFWTYKIYKNILKLISTPNSQYARLGRLTLGAIKKEAKIIWNFICLNRRWVSIKNQIANFNRKKSSKKSHSWFWVQWLAVHTPRPAKDQYAKKRWLTERASPEEEKIISKLLYLTRRWALIKSQRAHFNIKISNFMCTGWQSTPKY